MLVEVQRCGTLSRAFPDFSRRARCSPIFEFVLLSQDNISAEPRIQRAILAQRSACSLSPDRGDLTVSASWSSARLDTCLAGSRRILLTSSSPCHSSPSYLPIPTWIKSQLVLIQHNSFRDLRLGPNASAQQIVFKYTPSPSSNRNHGSESSRQHPGPYLWRQRYQSSR